MKSKLKVLLISVVVLAICAFGTVFVGYAAGGEPGSQADPLASQSYVDKKVAEVMNAVSGGSVSSGTISGADQDELLAMVEYAVRDYVVKNEGASFQPVQVPQGGTIIGGEGAEMILRTGKGTIVTSTDSVVNATSGVDLKNGASVPSGNLLIFPRADGRGVKVTAAAWFLVKGNYTIN